MTDQWGMLKPYPNEAGYQYVGIWIDRKRYRTAVHHLVLEAFVGQRPVGLFGLHKDNNPGNNVVDNLYWGTQIENMKQASSEGRLKRKDHVLTNLSPVLVWVIEVLFKDGWSGPEIAKHVGVGRNLVYKVINRNGLTREKKRTRRSAMSEEVYEMIIDGLKIGTSHQMLADDHGFSASLIGQIAKGWKPRVFKIMSPNVDL
jgi:hypothetical protein